LAEIEQPSIGQSVDFIQQALNWLQLAHD